MMALFGCKCDTIGYAQIMTPSTTIPARTHLDYVVRVADMYPSLDGFRDEDYALIGAEWGQYLDHEDLRVLMVTGLDHLPEIEDLLDRDPTVAAYAVVADPDELDDDEAWDRAAELVRA
jgi:hypothetical protein